MIPSLLITFREVIEASLIVATILGILTKLNRKQEIKTVWLATLTAASFICLIILGASFLGLQIQELYEDIEPLIEGILMISSSLFITWAVFFLHTYFAKQKMHLLQKVKSTIAQNAQKGIFLLVFTAVFREGFEIALFLTTMYFSETPIQIFSGFSLGIISGLLVSFSLFSATIRIPIFWAFRATSALLIVFAAGLLARGLGELMEAGVVPTLMNLPTFTFSIVPVHESFTGHLFETLFGISHSMHAMQLILYTTYMYLMHRRVFVTYSNKSKKVT